MKKIISILRLRLLVVVGNLINWSGAPGFVRECDYSASISDVLVSVRVSPLFTVINVNGVDIYFYRISGKIDGIGGCPEALGTSPESMEV